MAHPEKRYFFSFINFETQYTASFFLSCRGRGVRENHPRRIWQGIPREMRRIPGFHGKEYPFPHRKEIFQENHCFRQIKYAVKGQKMTKNGCPRRVSVI